MILKIVIVSIVSCRKLLTETRSVTIFKNTVYQNSLVKFKSGVKIFPNEPFKDFRGTNSGRHWGGQQRGVQAPPPIIFTEALVLKSGSTRKFSFQEMEPLLII